MRHLYLQLVLGMAEQGESPPDSPTYDPTAELPEEEEDQTELPVEEEGSEPAAEVPSDEEGIITSSHTIETALEPAETSVVETEAVGTTTTAAPKPSTMATAAVKDAQSTAVTATKNMTAVATATSTSTSTSAAQAVPIYTSARATTPVVSSRPAPLLSPGNGVAVKKKNTLADAEKLRPIKRVKLEHGRDGQLVVTVTEGANNRSTQTIPGGVTYPPGTSQPGPAGAAEPANKKRCLRRSEADVAKSKADMASAEQAIALDPYDTQAWGILLTELQEHLAQKARAKSATSTEEEEEPLLDIDVTSIMERFLKVFPTAARYWKFYIETEIAAGNYQRAEDLFQRCLLSVPDLDLWRTYLRYTEIIQEGQPDRSEKMETAFEFALKHLGGDLHAKSLWKLYIEFLKKEQERIPGGGVGGEPSDYQKNEAQTKLRKVYQRAIVQPMLGVETIWREYDLFEHSCNTTLAKQLLGEYQPN
eukprot:g34258.t1